MTTVGRRTFIGADIEKIYDILTDVSRTKEWFEHIADIKPSGDFPRDGGAADIVFRYGNVELNYTMIVTEFVENEYAVFKLEGDMVGTQRWSTTPERGGYRLSIDYDYDLPKFGMSKFVERITRETLNKSLHNLKSLVEVKETPAYH
jgi:uncharacterized protein YndB with AHSA1/START domain